MGFHSIHDTQRFRGALNFWTLKNGTERECFRAESGDKNMEMREAKNHSMGRNPMVRAR
jgi:hypothetical protein